jgi:hypothetical protein
MRVNWKRELGWGLVLGLFVLGYFGANKIGRESAEPFFVLPTGRVVKIENKNLDYLDALIREHNKTLPVTIGGASLVRIERNGMDVIYTNHVSCCEASEFEDNEELKEIFGSSMEATMKLVCSEKPNRFFANGLNIVYKYFGSDWKLIDAITITKGDCR